MQVLDILDVYRLKKLIFSHLSKRYDLALKVGYMKSMVFLILCLSFSCAALGQVSLRVGDLLLQPLNCWTCNLIEAEEKTIYSHMGLVISVNPLLIAESIGEVHAVPLTQFAVKTERGQRLAVMRIKNGEAAAKFKQHASELWNEFTFFRGKKFDKKYLWDNVDENGEELYYCSEFITKLLSKFLEMEMPIKRMHYYENRLEWEKYFEGKIPDGEWGNSPSDYYRSNLFEFIGEL